MADAQALRRPPHAGIALVSDPPRVALAPTATMARFAVRADHETALRIGSAFGVELPTTPLRSASRENRAALWLGPDEWLLIAEDGDALSITAAVAAALNGHVHSWVDVSHRNAGFLLSGVHAADVLNAGCPLPLDPAAFPVGKCARTVFGKAEIVLWRVGDAEFRIEVWRSFAAYVAGLIAEAAREHRA